MQLLKEIETDEMLPKNVLHHIHNIIFERSIYIDEDYKDNPNKDSMKLILENFRIYKWKIDGKIYYDICHSIDDAEVGYLIRIEHGIELICEIEESSVIKIKGSKYNKKWCKEFEKQRFKMLDF